MRQVFTPVQPRDPQPDGSTHPRAGQAGTVCSVPQDDPSVVGVKWDGAMDGTGAGDVTVEQIANLRQL